MAKSTISYPIGSETGLAAHSPENTTARRTGRQQAETRMRRFTSSKHVGGDAGVPSLCVLRFGLPELVGRIGRTDAAGSGD